MLVVNIRILTSRIVFLLVLYYNISEEKRREGFSHIFIGLKKLKNI